MPINTKELLDCLTMILDEENMKVTIKESGKGTLVCATVCFIGGLLAGPVGLAVGGTIGGIGALIMTKDSFKPVSEIIRDDLTVAQKEMLAQKIFSAINEFHPKDIAALLALLANNQSLQKSVIETVANFLTKEMKLRIID